MNLWKTEFTITQPHGGFHGKRNHDNFMIGTSLQNQRLSEICEEGKYIKQQEKNNSYELVNSYAIQQ